jgi:RNA polymerase sigma-70 factor (ECF subfamily)
VLDAGENALLLELSPVILRRHCSKVWRVILAWGVPERDAEDVLQEVFLSVFTQISDHGIKHNLRTTIGVVTRGKLLHYLRDHRSEPDTIAIPDSGLDLPESALDFERAVDLRKLTQRFVPELMPAHRDVVKKVVLEGLTEAEAAAALGIPTGTVKSRLRVAMQVLRMLAAPWMPESQREAE